MSIKKIVYNVFVLLFAFILMNGKLFAEEKVWNADGDGTTWESDANWWMSGHPIEGDNVTIDMDAAAVTINQTFEAESITLGGKENVELRKINFVHGTIEPDSTSDVAITNKSGGHLILEGIGTVTVRGTYLDTLGTSVNEPSFMFWVK